MFVFIHHHGNIWSLSMIALSIMYVWGHSCMLSHISITLSSCCPTPKNWGIKNWIKLQLGLIAKTLHQAPRQGNAQPLPVAAQRWGRCLSIPRGARTSSPDSWALLCWHPAQILGVWQPAMTVVEQLSGFLLSSDTGRSSIPLYYYTTFPCVCQLFLSYRELYSFQTSVMNLQKRSKFYLFL